MSDYKQYMWGMITHKGEYYTVLSFIDADNERRLLCAAYLVNSNGMYDKPVAGWTIPKQKKEAHDFNLFKKMLAVLSTEKIDLFGLRDTYLSKANILKAMKQPGKNLVD